MSDSQHSDTAKEVRSSEPSMLDVTPDSMSTAETLDTVDATSTEASHSDTPEELRPSEPSIPDLTSDSMSATKAPILVDATPTEASLAGNKDKDLTNSITLNCDVSGCSAQRKSHSDFAFFRHRTEDPDFQVVSPSKITRNIVTPDHIRSLDSYPWGYPRMAAVWNCDANFSIYGKFGWLHNRVLLHLQADLIRLEDDLQDWDNWQAERPLGNERKGLWSHHVDKSRRKEMLAEIKTKLAEYDDLVFRLQKKNAMKRPPKTNQDSVHRQAYRSVVSSEAAWTLRTDDLVALAHGAATPYWITQMMIYVDSIAPRLVKGIFGSRERCHETGSLPFVMLYSPIRTDAFCRGILTLVGTAIILGPVSAPSLLCRNPILTIYASTLGFSIFCAVFSKASRDQVFAATGGYCALQVMVMLLGPHLK